MGAARQALRARRELACARNGLATAERELHARGVVRTASASGRAAPPPGWAAASGFRAGAAARRSRLGSA